ncbi:hypothetical protein CGL27_38695 [Streptomyces sp. 11-1-2]|nr:hypothetical protein CGL27_38695 [Streptomyces sp. 11-1-2]
MYKPLEPALTGDGGEGMEGDGRGLMLDGEVERAAGNASGRGSGPMRSICLDQRGTRPSVTVRGVRESARTPPRPADHRLQRLFDVPPYPLCER